MVVARPTILLVERDLPTRQLYQRALEADFQVLAASTLEEALPLVGQHPLSAIVCEPGPAGAPDWAWVFDRRGLPTLDPAPLIVCTSQDQHRHHPGVGAAAYLVKPVLPAALVAVVRRFARPQFIVGVSQ